MKKLLVVLLSMGLIVAFGMTASAADVKFGGSYYVVGNYESNPSVANSDLAYSRAIIYQRFRLQPVFAIAEGLTFTGRFDAMEKMWGNSLQRNTVTTVSGQGWDDQTSSRRMMNANQKEQESLEWERAWVTFRTAIGQFDIGYQNVDDWGTDFGDYSNSRPKAMFTTKLGPVALGFAYEKIYENSTVNTTVPYANASDADKDSYAFFGIYNAGGIEGGMLIKYYALNSSRPQAASGVGYAAAPGYPGVKTAFTLLSPYVKATFGPFYVEGELQYWFGNMAQFEQPAKSAAGYALAALPQDVDLKAYGAYLKAKMNVGPAYFGGMFAYSSGNDLSDDTKTTANPGGAGTNLSPALILLNDGYNTQMGGTASTGNSLNGGVMPTTNKYNVMIGNAFVGFNATPQLNVEGCVTYAVVDTKALSKNPVTHVVTNAVSDRLGTEVDVTASYKIYDNLVYMVGAGYLWTGDYFKGADDNKQIGNTYLLMNKLTLSF